MKKSSGADGRAKWYDVAPNKQIRERINDELQISNAEAAERMKAHGVKATAEAVRQWTSGYTRPDVTKLVGIADALGVSCNYLLGLTEARHAEDEQLADELGLSSKAIGNLRKLKSVASLGDDAVNSLQGLTMTDAFAESLNAVICSDEFQGIIALFQSVADMRGDLYGVWNGKTQSVDMVSEEQAEVSFVFGKTAFRMRDVLRSQYDSLTNSLYNTVVEQIKPKSPLVGKVTIEALANEADKPE